MTQTAQSHSLVLLSEPAKGLTIKECEAEVAENINLVLSLFDSMNKLGEALRKLNYLIGRKS